jgi:glycosyltransferase involved in cell wall biosynthesis
MEPHYSFIVPVYNRPGELQELLESMAGQTYTNFEVVIIEDGSDLKSDELVRRMTGRLDIRYLDLPRSGPSTARNAGAQAASGEYLVFVDSDCILPAEYLHQVNNFLENQLVDFFGGPDQASEDFNLNQKAISYAMTSFLTTGGIRGGKKKVTAFYPRSFNMGISRRAFIAVGGFPETRMHPGEDMVLSIELIANGFPAGLIREAFVYHKRRTTLVSFFKQVYGFGKTRYIISRVYPETFKLLYLAPSVFLAGVASLLVLTLLYGWVFLLPVILWISLVWIDASFRNRSLLTGIMAVIASFFQLSGYGSGFLYAWWTGRIMGKDQYGVFLRGFYPDR